MDYQLMNFAQKFVRYIGENVDEHGWEFADSRRLLMVLNELVSRERVTQQEYAEIIKKHYNVSESVLDECLEKAGPEAGMWALTNDR